MAKYHINPETGNPGICRADPSKPGSRGCRFGESEAEHYATREEAARAYEARMEATAKDEPAKDPEALTEELRDRLIRPQSVDFDTISRELGWIAEWEKPWTAEETENIHTVEKIAAILERDPLSEADEVEAQDLIDGLHGAVTPQQRGGYRSDAAHADNWRARDRMIRDLAENLLRRRLADGLSHGPAEALNNPRLLGLRDAQESVLKSYNHPDYDWQNGPELGEVEEHFQEAIARVRRGDAPAPERILQGTDQRSLLPESERIFNTLHPDSPLYSQQLYLASVFPVNELKDEMDRVGIEDVSVSSLANGREWGNVYTVLTAEGGTRSFAVYEHRNTDSIIINGKDNWDGQGLPYAGDSKQTFFAEFAPDDRKRAAQALTFYMMQAQSGVLESDEELAAKVSRRDWNAILDGSIPGFKAWRQNKITDDYIAPEQELEEDILKRLDF